jgi:hypothetical protein
MNSGKTTILRIMAVPDLPTTRLQKLPPLLGGFLLISSMVLSATMALLPDVRSSWTDGICKVVVHHPRIVLELIGTLGLLICALGIAIHARTPEKNRDTSMEIVAPFIMVTLAFVFGLWASPSSAIPLVCGALR